ncbi:DUF4328 domain-containing protein [Flavobacterium sp. SM2513]|uniref:DUF4328 domain-containing protein n=1 Tax=Flavobacterium sp. SM2513 TaxID=3424766 RepID=UPI003D7FA76C
MTEAQIEDCDQCLNRRRGTDDLERICTIKGKNTDFDDKCTDFDQDSSVVVGVQDKVNAIRPNKKRAEIAQLFIWAVMVIQIISTASSYFQLQLLNAINTNEEVTDVMIASNDDREQLVAITYLAVLFISMFAFILWFRRAYYNLSMRTRCVYGEGWAAGGWFVPIMNLVRPYRIMMELSTKTTHLINIKTSNVAENNTFLIGLWWTLWIIGNVVGKVLTRANPNSETIEGLLQSTRIDIGLSAFFIPLSIVTVLMIQSYAKKEEMLCELETVH